MKTCIALCLIILLVFPAWTGSLGDFKDEVEEEKSRSGESESSGRKSGDSNSDFSLIGAIIEGLYWIFSNNMEQEYARMPYDNPNPYNYSYTQRRWQLDGLIEYRYYDNALYNISGQVHFTFLSALKVKLGVDTFFEDTAEGRDTLNRIKVLFGFDLLALDNFKLDMVTGWHHVGDVDATFSTIGFSTRVFPFKPLVFEWSYWYGAYGSVKMHETALRLGFVIDAIGIHEIGIGYNWTRLGSVTPMDTITLHVRWWM